MISCVKKWILIYFWLCAFIPFMDTAYLDKHPALIATPQVREICKPLFEQFNMNFFHYTHLSKNGEYKTFTTEPGYIKWALSNDLSAAIDVKNNFQSGHYLWEHIHSPKLPTKSLEKTRTQLTFLREELNIYNCLMVVGKIHEGNIEIFDFGFPKDNIEAVNTSINHYDSIERFINHFKDIAHPLIKLAGTYTPLTTIAETTPITPTEDFFEKQENFLRSTKIEHLHLPDNIKISLCRRELECFIYTLQGNSASQIASILRISTKTVEWHINNIKTKFGCKKRSDLFKVAMELGILSVAKLL